MSRRLVPLLLLAAFLAPAGPAGPRPAEAQEDPRPDSTEWRARARDAQHRFERLRVRHLPRALSGGGSECDDRVGRMCWRHDGGGFWEPEPEHEDVESAREDLLASLERAGNAIPGDGWVLGQRVRYLGEAGRWEDASLLLEDCAAERWWCWALRGLALHERARYPAAAAAFDTALAALAAVDPAQAEEWRDPRPLLDTEGRRAWDEAREGGAAVRKSFLGRLWGLADPLWMVPGSDRETAHLARQVGALVREDARNAHGIAWGGDLAELLLRYGPAVAWERSMPAVGALDRGDGVVGHEHPESRGFIPPGTALVDPAAAASEVWIPHRAYAPSAYAPPHAPVFLPAPVRLEVVPLGDSVAVLAAWDLPADTTRLTRRGRDWPLHRPDGVGMAPPHGALVLRPLNRLGDETGQVVVPAAELPARASAVVPRGLWMASVEAWDPEALRAGRVREVVRAPRVAADVVTASDLLLLDPGPEPRSISDLARMLSLEGEAVAGGRLRVAWVVTGLGFRPETVGYGLALREPDGGVLRRLGRRVGLVGEIDGRTVAWTESAPERPGPVVRAVELDLTGLDPGPYLLRLELTVQGRDPVVRERRIEVVRR